MPSDLRNPDRCQSIIRHPIEINLPPCQNADLLKAAEAVKQEYQSSIKWKKLRCREVHPTDDGVIFTLNLGQSVEFDWTWEGATAFRPNAIDDDISSLSGTQEETDSAIWFGMDCRLTTRDGQPCVEWTWDGNNEMDPAQGRGWANSTNSTMKPTKPHTTPEVRTRNG